MSQAISNLHPAARATLERWHELIAAQDLSTLPEIVHPDAVFRSPVAFKPYGPAPALVLILRTVMTVFEEFTYHREFVGDDGTSVVLEFSARVGGKQLKGVDIVTFDEAGKIAEFEVMVRPLSALQALGDEMGARLGAPPSTDGRRSGG